MNPSKLADALEPFVSRADYGTRCGDTGQFVEGYVLRPDRNSSGYITHWHIDVVPEKEA